MSSSGEPVGGGQDENRGLPVPGLLPLADKVSSQSAFVSDLKNNCHHWSLS